MPDAAPVASLQPRETAKLWRRLVATRARRARVTADCRPLRAVFYAATDFLRLATTLAASASPCAQYYISVPPLVSDKTRIRADSAWRIRALGPNFHAMAEVQYAGWSKWVASTGSSWFTAGVTARERMVAAGYDVSQGDTWALNEASSAVRRGTGSARTDLRDFLRGLYEGDGSQPTRGTVFVIGVGQPSSDVSVYQTNLQNWFTDSAFWSDVSTYVSDWSQEVFGDPRNYDVPEMPLSVRRDYLNDYLQHVLVLAGVGPPTIDTARTYLESAFSPLANAAWQWPSGYGWTMVPEAQMAGYVSAQIYALRYFSATTGQPADHWGFAWSPKNPAGIPANSFATQTGQILDRLAQAVRDSGQTDDPADPGSGACGPNGQNVWCTDDLDGAHLTEAWKSFRSWTQPVLAFTTPAQTIPAGGPSAPMSLALVTSTGRAATTATPLAVTLSSNSAQGTFSTSPTGPWSSTLSLTIAAGSGTAPAFYYEDTLAGSHLLTATATGTTSGTQIVTVTPGPLQSLTVTPASATVRAQASQRFGAVGRDAYGNSAPISVTWSLSPRALGTIEPTAGNATVLTARRTLGPGTITAATTAASGTISSTGAVRVAPGRLTIGSIQYQDSKRAIVVTVAAEDTAGKPVSGAMISVLVRRDDRSYLSVRTVTGPAGQTSYRFRARRGGCFTTSIRSASAVGFVWDGQTPRNRYCRAPAQ